MIMIKLCSWVSGSLSPVTSSLASLAGILPLHVCRSSPCGSSVLQPSATSVLTLFSPRTFLVSVAGYGSGTGSKTAVVSTIISGRGLKDELCLLQQEQVRYKSDSELLLHEFGEPNKMWCFLVCEGRRSPRKCHPQHFQKSLHHDNVHCHLRCDH